MNVLEIEEAESLVGSKRGGTRKLPPSRTTSIVGDGLASQLVRRNFLTNVVIVAAVALMLLFLVSSGGGDDVAASEAGSKNNNNNHISPSPDANSSNNSAPVASPSEGQPPVNPEQSSEETEAETKAPEVEEETPKEPHPINVYSKFATVTPLRTESFADEETASKLQTKWGNWHFWDDEEEDRPTEDFLAKYPNRDCPADEFPEGAWQADAVFVNHYLNDASKLVTRAIEAIYEEYGYPGGNLTAEELVARSKQIFHWSITENMNYDAKGSGMPRRTYDGLIRRLLHAMMTSDTFTVTLGGHSVAAGAGNKFQQNYLMQFHRIMHPIFARLGVKLVSRNMAQGGLPTIQGSLGMLSFYGDMDLLLWDSQMTEGGHYMIDFFFRQGILGGDRVPVCLGTAIKQGDIMHTLYDYADADVGSFAGALTGIRVTENAAQAQEVPHAVRYWSCGPDIKDFCKAQPRFCTFCWDDESLGEPPIPQRQQFSDNGNFHPGWREQQMRGRHLAMGVLRALQEAIALWTDNVQGGPPLDESFWHVTDHYNNTRTKLRNMDPSVGRCYGGFIKTLPPRICNTAMKGVTQYTPRKDPELTGVSSVAKPAPDGTVPRNPWKVGNFEMKDEPRNKCMVIPEGEVDVYAIVTGRRRRLNGMGALNRTQPTISSPAGPSKRKTVTENGSRALETGIVPGKGWEVIDEPNGNCDGTYDSMCLSDFGCLLSGYNSCRGGVVGNEFSGWLVLNLADLKEGLIILKLDPYWPPNKNTITANWTSVNNEGRELVSSTLPASAAGRTSSSINATIPNDEHRRRLKQNYEVLPQPESLVFEYAIDGQITTIPRDEFLQSRMKRIARTTFVITLLDDPNFTDEKKDVELAIRMRGCGRTCTFGVTHAYWA